MGNEEMRKRGNVVLALAGMCLAGIACYSTELATSLS